MDPLASATPNAAPPPIIPTATLNDSALDFACETVKTVMFSLEITSLSPPIYALICGFDLEDASAPAPLMMPPDGDSAFAKAS